MAIVNISGTINSSFSASGQIVNAAQAAGDAVFTIDLRPTNPIIIVQDNLDYGVLGWNINDAVAVIILSGPQGEIYRNEDFNSPDIVPGTSRYLNKTITLPLDPLTDYSNILKGNYTLKISWYNSILDEYYNFLDTYQYNFDPPTIENTTVSGPYTGVLTSTDTTEYGLNVHQIIREHRIQYPTQLAVPPPDVVNSNEEIQVSPIYTNQWKILISSFVEYRNPDTLRIYWEGSGEFTHCVYGGCIGAMYDAIETMLATYTDSMACNVNNQEDYQKRLVIVNTAWHLLNEAYWSGDAEEADQQAYIIQEQVAYTGSGVCEGSTSELVTPCPPWTGGGVGGTYTFQNGLTEAAGVVSLGGTLLENTTLNGGEYGLRFAGVVGSDESYWATGINSDSVWYRQDVTSTGRIYVKATGVEFDYLNAGTPSLNKKYIVNENGLVEDSDYSTDYIGLSLVNKNYVDGLFAGAASYTFENALTDTAGVVRVGGTLTQDTEILSGAYSWTHRGTDVDTSVDFYQDANRIRMYTFSSPDLDTSLPFASLTIQSTSVVSIASLAASDGANPIWLSVSADEVEILDNINSKGAVYAEDYSTEGITDDRWIPDYGAVKAYADSVAGTTIFTGLTDTPSSYAGFGNYFLQVNAGESGIQFVSGSWVPVTGGTFTGQITIATSTDRPLIIQQIGAGSNPGSPEGGLNLIAFQDNDGDEQGYVGIDASGNVVLSSWVTGGNVLVNDNLNVNGDITPTGIIYVDTILERTPNNGVFVEGVKMEDGGITLVTGATVNEIETVLTDDDTHIPTSGAVFDAIFAGSIIDTDTTIYVETTGDDITGDGTIGSPFATLYRALQSLAGIMISACKITVQFGAGIFRITLECLEAALKISTVHGGSLVLNGQTTADGSLDLVQIEGSRYSVTGGISSQDQYQYHILGFGPFSFPIGKHSTSELRIPYQSLAGSRNISTLDTTLIADRTTQGNGSVSCTLLLQLGVTGTRSTSINASTATFNNLIVEADSDIQSWGSNRTAIQFYGCYIRPSSNYDSLETAPNFISGPNDSISIVSCLVDISDSSVLIRAFSSPAEVGVDYTKIYGTSGQNGISYQNALRKTYIASLIFEGFDYGITSEWNQFNLNLYVYISFYDCTTAILWHCGYMVVSFVAPPEIQLYGTDYLVEFTGDKDLRFYVGIDNVLGSPNIDWLHPDSVNEGYYDPSIAMDIIIPGIFREVDTINEETLVDNGITYLVVGDTQQNRSIHLMYTIERDTTYQEGEIKILYDGTDLFILDDFQDNDTPPGVAFTADINGTEIRLIATATSTGTDATFKAQVRRIMYDGGPTTFQYIVYDTTTYAVAAETLYQHGIHYVRRRIVGNVYHIDITIDGIGFAGTEDVNWGNLISINGQDSDFRSGERGGNFVVDCEITATGFAGVEDTDWENLSNSAGGGALTIYRDGIRNHAYVIDKVLTATGFAGVEDTDWENLVNLKIP